MSRDVSQLHPLLRWVIPEIIERSGSRALWHAAGPEETVKGLEDKLTEELSEYLADHSLEELADLLEVMHGIIYHRGASWEELEAIRLKKREERGGFERGIRLEATETE